MRLGTTVELPYWLGINLASVPDRWDRGAFYEDASVYIALCMHTQRLHFIDASKALHLTSPKRAICICAVRQSAQPRRRRRMVLLLRCASGGIVRFLFLSCNASRPLLTYMTKPASTTRSSRKSYINHSEHASLRSWINHNMRLPLLLPRNRE